MNALIELLGKIKNQVPVTWDRWVVSDDENPYYCVYGWIKRKDGDRDFLAVQMWDSDAMEDAFFLTSSAKYSALICLIVTGSVADHTKCRKIEELIFPIPTQ